MYPIYPSIFWERHLWRHSHFSAHMDKTPGAGGRGEERGQWQPIIWTLAGWRGWSRVWFLHPVLLQSLCCSYWLKWLVYVKAGINLDLNLPFPWWLCQTLGKRGVAVLLKDRALLGPMDKCWQSIHVLPSTDLWIEALAREMRVFGDSFVVSISSLSALSILLLMVLSPGAFCSGCCFLSLQHSPGPARQGAQGWCFPFMSVLEKIFTAWE